MTATSRSRNLRTILLIGGPVGAAARLARRLRGLGHARCGRSRRCAGGPPRSRPPSPSSACHCPRPTTSSAGSARRSTGCSAVSRRRSSGSAAFVDDASHELRTPLAMHKTELELALRYAKTPEEMRAAIASAIVEVDRLIQLAEDLLVLARSRAGQAGARPAAGRASPSCSATCASASPPGSAEAGRSLVVEPANGLTVEADRLRLEQALTNLVENAHRARRWRDHRAGQRGRRRGRRSTSRTAAPGSRRSSSSAPSSASAAPIRRVAATAPDWAWRSSRRSPAPTGDSAHAANRNGSGADVWIELPAQPR